MKQADLGLNLSTKRTRKREFLDEMNRVVPWAALVELIEPHYPKGKTGRPPMGIETMLRIHFLQQWFGLSDPAMEEALHDVPLYREFADLDGPMRRLPDESTILRFRHLLEKHQLAGPLLAAVNQVLQAHGLMLKIGTVVDATLISAPSSTKNGSGERDPEMHQTKKGNQWYFGMKAHIGADAESGLVHTVIGTPANTNDVTQAEALLHGEETAAFGRCRLPGRAEAARIEAVELVHRDASGQAAQAAGSERSARRDHRRDRTAQGQRACQGRASVSGDQAPVRFHEGPLSRAGEEHGADHDAVRAVESVDGVGADRKLSHL
jgi:IS5 family transposase